MPRRKRFPTPHLQSLTPEIASRHIAYCFSEAEELNNQITPNTSDCDYLEILLEKRKYLREVRCVSGFILQQVLTPEEAKHFRRCLASSERAIAECNEIISHEIKVADEKKAAAKAAC